LPQFVDPRADLVIDGHLPETAGQRCCATAHGALGKPTEVAMRPA